MFKTTICSGRRSSARRLIRLTFARITVLGVVGALAACGGGGGGGGGNSGGGGGGGGTIAPLVYTGNLNPAVITTSNAAILTANIFGVTDSSAALPAGAPSTAALSAAASSASSGARDLSRSLSRAARATPVPAASRAPRVMSEPVDFGVAPCANGGSVRTFGDLNVSGTGTLTFMWSRCASDDTTLDGTATMRIDAVDPVADAILDSTFNFQRVTVTTPNTSGTVSGSVRSQVDVPGKTETTTSDLVSLDSAGRMTMTQNFEVVDTAGDISAPTRVTEKIRGRLFDGVHGFVDIGTNADLVFASNTQEFPDAGELLLTGAAMAHIRATAFSSTAVTLHLDLNGDNVFEITASLAWTELAGRAGTDLRDTDGDGMHDSWETAHGLNPMSPTDGGMTDSDGDGATNFAEYQAGTDPRDPASRPPAPPPPSTPGA